MDFLCDRCNNADAKVLRIRSLGQMANPFINLTSDTCNIQCTAGHAILVCRQEKKGPIEREIIFGAHY